MQICELAVVDRGGVTTTKIKGGRGTERCGLRGVVASNRYLRCAPQRSTEPGAVHAHCPADAGLV